MLLRILITIAALLSLFTLACDTEPEITVDDAHVTLDHATDPFAIKSQLTPEQASGDADVLVAYKGITHFIADNKPVSRTPGKVVAWRDRQVEVLYSRKDRDSYVRVWVDYGEDFDTGKLHDDKDNIARCRYEEPTGWPMFVDCNRVN